MPLTSRASGWTISWADDSWEYKFQGGFCSSAMGGNGLYFFQHRAYDPFRGIWLQQDPAGFVNGMNLHEGLGSNPVSRLDPSGLFWSEVVTVGCVLWDTGMVLTGQIGGKEYAWRMGINGLALAADVATGGWGGGPALRLAAFGARAARYAKAIPGAIRIAEGAGRAAQWAERTVVVGKTLRAIGTGARAVDTIAGTAQVIGGGYGLYKGIERGDVIGGLDAGRNGIQALVGIGRAIRCVRSVNPTAVEEAGAAARNWLGEGAVIKPSRSSFVVQSKDGLRQLRLDLSGHGDLPHAHLQVWDAARVRFVDAPEIPHRLYFQGTSNP